MHGCMVYREQPGGSFSNRDLEVKVNPSILKDEFSERTDPFIFKPIDPVLFDQSNKTS